MRCTAIILAAGRGERFGDTDKIMVPLLDRPVIAWSLDAFEAANAINEITIVAGAHTLEPIRQLVARGRWSKVTSIVAGGDSRQGSMVNGASSAAIDTDIIAVHDAARPLIKPEQIDQCIAAASLSGAAIVAAPVTDTIKRVAETGVIEATIDRSALRAAQTPQAFRADLLRRMITEADSHELTVTDEASMAEHLGIPIRIVEGDSTNIKITHPYDLIVAEALLRARRNTNE